MDRVVKAKRLAKVDVFIVIVVEINLNCECDKRSKFGLEVIGE